MPVEVDWSKNDTSLIGRFWDQRPGEQDKAAEISDRILVYHRGIDTVHFWSYLCATYACVPNMLCSCSLYEWNAFHDIL